MVLEQIDLVIVGLYAIGLFAIAILVSREPAGHQKDTEDYFLAGKALPWWAIGASLIAANISAEQIIGQSGQGFVVGLAIAAYEWQAAIVLLITAKFFLPIFLDRKIYTMPQFLESRFGPEIKTVMAIFWITLYTFVNLTAILWLGGLAITTVTGLDVLPAMAGLALFALLYSLYGGLKAVALTDIIQVVVLILGGFAILYISLSLVGGERGVWAGLNTLYAEIPGHFEMILSPDNSSYSDLPGIWTLLGGLWVLHFSYWGFNQYIIQRALGAENVQEAQKGLVFAAFLKLLIPVIVVIPGIAALWLAQNGALPVSDLSETPDKTYGFLMTLAPAGLRGIVFAALIAAIVSSLASMINSIATIFTMDIYRDHIAADKNEQHYVLVGRLSAAAAMLIAFIVTKPFLGGMESAFQTIQEYTGFIAPGIVAVFLLGFFWKRANREGAFALLISSIALSVTAKLFLPEMPFVLRIWIVFLICLVVGVCESLATRRPAPEQPVDLGGISFATRPSFNIAATLITLILVFIYVAYW